MAQVLAVPRDRRHVFWCEDPFFHDFGRITGIAVSNENNVLLCDYTKHQLLLFDEEGNYLSCLPLTSGPWDVAISNQNTAFVTMPTEQCILQVDPDKLSICTKTVFGDPNAFISCVSSAKKQPNNFTYVGYVSNGRSTVTPIIEAYLNIK
jgi:hypothetical protein